MSLLDTHVKHDTHGMQQIYQNHPILKVSQIVLLSNVVSRWIFMFFFLHSLPINPVGLVMKYRNLCYFI